MAKHAHRLLLNQKKTWRCTLPGCSYFIHIGLAHILPGKQSICWECGEEFTLDEIALRDDNPICNTCRAKRDGWNMEGLSDYIEAKTALGNRNIKDLTPTARNMIEAVKGVKLSVLEKDEIEVIEPNEKDVDKDVEKE